MRLGLITTLLIVGFASPTVARANGAFPDSFQIFAPPDRPNQIILAAYQGLFVSEDDGRRWYWVCEPAIGRSPGDYQQGPPPASLLYARDTGLYVTADLCAWSEAQGLPPETEVTDVSPDVNDPLHTLAIGVVRSATTSTYSLFESVDGGLTFSRAIYRARVGMRLDSVEIPRGEPGTIYLTASSTASAGRYLLRSKDEGAHFETFDHRAETGRALLRITQVDPQNPLRIYFRVDRTGTNLGDSLAISDDGGSSVRIALTIEVRMSSFLRRPDGTLIVGSTNGGYMSTDGGAKFTRWANAPHIRALAARGGAIYAAGSDLQDGFAAGVTHDNGASWTPLFSYRHVRSPANCPAVRRICCGFLWMVLKNQLAVVNDDGVCTQGESDTSSSSMPATGSEMDGGARGNVTAGVNGCACFAGGPPRRRAPVALFALFILLRARPGRQYISARAR